MRVKIVDTKAFERVISGLSQFSVGAGQTFSHPITPAHCFGAVPSVRCVLIRCVFALTFTGTRFLFPGFCVIWFVIFNKRPLNWVAKLRQIMASVQLFQQTELTPSNVHCTVHGFAGQRARGINILNIQCQHNIFQSSNGIHYTHTGIISSPSMDHRFSSFSKSGMWSSCSQVSFSLTNLATASLLTALKLPMFSSTIFGRMILGAIVCRTLCHSSPSLL